MFRVEHLDHVAIAVKDVRASARWYQETLGLERRFADAWGDGPPIMMCAGATCVALFPVEGDPAPAPGRGAVAMRHFAFVVDRANFDAARSTFERTGTAHDFADHGICHSVYINDPDGHRIELTTYDLG